MVSLNATTRTKGGRQEGLVPAVVYGHNLGKNDVISVDAREFRTVLREAGESSLIDLALDGKAAARTVLVKDIQHDPVSGAVIHVDFFQPNLKEKVEVAVPLVFTGAAPAEKDLGGTLNRNMQEIEVRALPQDLPHEITVDIGKLATFEDHILVKDLPLPANVEALKEPDEIVASVLEPRDVEAELAQEITEDVSKVGEAEEKKPEEEAVPEEAAEEK